MIFSGGLPRIEQLLNVFSTHNIVSITLNAKGIPGLKGVIHRCYPDAKSGIVYRIYEGIGD
ncbi:hypothetical protein D3C77_704060 [compost metagenome]